MTHRISNCIINSTSAWAVKNKNEVSQQILISGGKNKFISNLRSNKFVDKIVPINSHF